MGRQAYLFMNPSRQFQVEARPDGAHGRPLVVKAVPLPRVRIRDVAHFGIEEAPQDTQRPDPQVQTARSVKNQHSFFMNDIF